jgi:hypothetical protein
MRPVRIVRAPAASERLEITMLFVADRLRLVARAGSTDRLSGCLGPSSCLEHDLGLSDRPTQPAHRATRSSWIRRSSARSVVASWP